jgi:hypothetical protein
MDSLFHENFLSLKEAEEIYHEIRRAYDLVKARYAGVPLLSDCILLDRDRQALETCVDLLVALSQQTTVKENTLDSLSLQGECVIPLLDRVGWLQGNILWYAAAAQDLLK